MLSDALDERKWFPFHGLVRAHVGIVGTISQVQLAYKRALLFKMRSC